MSDGTKTAQWPEYRTRNTQAKPGLAKFHPKNRPKGTKIT